MLYVPRVIFAVLADAVKIHRVIFDRTSEIFRCYVLDFADVTHCKVCHAVTFSANEMVMRGSISIEPVRAISCCKTLISPNSERRDRFRYTMSTLSIADKEKATKSAFRGERITRPQICSIPMYGKNFPISVLAQYTGTCLFFLN